MRRRRVQEIEVNHERWLVSYADFITLLFAFFVVMYSVSQVNENKYRVLSDTLSEVFSVADPLSLKPIQVGDPAVANDPSVFDLPATTDAEALRPGTSSANGPFDRTADLPQLADRFEDQFSDLIDDEVFTVNSNEQWLELQLKSGLLFESGNALPNVRAETIFFEIADLLKGFNNPIQVEGHTDSSPINSSFYPTNWELSTARASAIVRILIQAGLSPERLAAAGYGQYYPVADNSTAEGRAENRRVVLMIAKAKIDRPTVSSRKDLEERIPEFYPEEPDVDPLEVQEQRQVETLIDELTTSPDEALPILLDQADESNTSSSGSTDSLASDNLSTESDEEGIQPRVLRGGGLLFSSDPDQPRDDQ